MRALCPPTSKAAEGKSHKPPFFTGYPASGDHCAVLGEAASLPETMRVMSEGLTSHPDAPQLQMMARSQLFTCTRSQGSETQHAAVPSGRSLGTSLLL